MVYLLRRNWKFEMRNVEREAFFDRRAGFSGNTGESEEKLES